MYEMKTPKKVLIVITFAAYLGFLALNKLAGSGGPGSKLFPHSVSNVSQMYPMDMTPSPPTFAIWGVIFLLQLAMLIYALTALCRPTPSADILSNGFFVSYTLNLVSLSVWLFVWCRTLIIPAFVANVLGQVFIYAAIGFAFRDLKEYLDNNKGEENADVWTHRILVQNALEFYATWGTVASSIGFAIVLSYFMGVPTNIASIVGLSIVAIIAILWFVVENSVLWDYTPCGLSVYLVLMIASFGIYSNIFSTDPVIRKMALGLLIGSGSALLGRIAIIVQRFQKISAVKYATLAKV